jgi:hypothetical protein
MSLTPIDIDHITGIQSVLLAQCRRTAASARRRTVAAVTASGAATGAGSARDHRATDARTERTDLRSDRADRHRRYPGRLPQTALMAEDGLRGGSLF